MPVDVVTVFGGGGFLGRYVVRALAASGARVTVAVRRPHQALHLKPMSDVGQITLLAANVRDDASVRQAVAGADVVINLVGILFERGRQRFHDVHAVGAGRIARAAAEAGAGRMIHVSAIGADRNSPSDYARSKAEGERLVREAFPGATVLRPSIVFGPEDELCNLFAALARVSPVLPLIGGGRTRFQPVYVGDVARAVMRVIEDGSTAGETFELGGPTVYTFRELLELILAVTGRRRLLVPVPFWAAAIEAFFLEFLPKPLLTRDQLRLLHRDNVVSAGARGLEALGIAPTMAEAVLPSYLGRYRRGGLRSQVQ